MIAEWYFGFHDRSSLSDIRRGEASWYSVFGHVEAFGYTMDETWLFFDPQGRRSVIEIAHRHDDVSELMARRWNTCNVIYKITPSDKKIVFPLHFTMNCVSQCAALMGWRAYTPAGFRAKLLRNGAEIIHGPTYHARGRGSKGSARA